jgi:predicted RNA binding protein YcfA (HicA-like mRNA interferase family)
MPPKVREILERLNDEGWQVERWKGDHRQLRHPTKPGTVTVAGKLSEIPSPKTLNSIKRQAGWKK